MQYEGGHKYQGVCGRQAGRQAGLMGDAQGVGQAGRQARGRDGWAHGGRCREEAKRTEAVRFMGSYQSMWKLVHGGGYHESSGPVPVAAGAWVWHAAVEKEDDWQPRDQMSARRPPRHAHVHGRKASPAGRPAAKALPCARRASSRRSCRGGEGERGRRVFRALEMKRARVHAHSQPAGRSTCPLPELQLR